MKRFAFLLLISFITSVCTKAQWVQTNGPSGGFTNEIFKIDTIMIVSAGNGGIYRSTNYGENWLQSTSGLPDDASIQVLTADSGVLFAGVYGNGIYKSNDLGKSWSAVSNDIGNLTFYGLFVSGDNIYAGNANGGIYYSPDHGITWTEKSNGISNIQFYSFANFNSKVYAGGTKLYESSNNGDSWNEVEIIGLNVNGIRAMVVHGNHFYVADDQFVFIATDSPDNWIKSTLNTYASVMSMGVSGDSVFLTTSNTKIFYTKDAGLTWTEIINNDASGSINHALFLDDQLIMSTSEGIYSSSDGGNNWIDKSSGLNAIQIESFNSNDSYLFAGTSTHGIYRTKNYGDSWERINSGLSDLNAKTINDILVFGQNVLLGTGAGVYLSNNGGDAWTKKFNPGINKSIQALDFGNGILATGVGDDGVYISTDTAETWQLAGINGLNTNTGYQSILVKGDTIIISTNDGEIFLTINRGTDWKDISIPGDTYFTYNLEFENDELYAATAKGLLISQDLGSTWTFFNNETLSVHDLIFEYEKIYAATSDGISYTSQFRRYWTSKSEQLGKLFVNNVFTHHDMAFAGTYGSSVWRRPKIELNLPPVIEEVKVTYLIEEDSTIEINLGDLMIDDPDTITSNDLTVVVNDGNNYSVDSKQIIPAENYNGNLRISFYVNDGIENGPDYETNIEIIPVNDAPVILNTMGELKTRVNKPIELNVEDFVINDPDNEIPADFTLAIQEGNNYTVESNFVTPQVDFIGDLIIPVSVNDGLEESPIYNANLKVELITGLESIKNESLIVYPNPSSGELEISFPSKFNDGIKINLIDIQGETVLSKSLSSVSIGNIESINLKNLPSGIYILSIYGNQNFLGSKRIVIK